MDQTIIPMMNFGKLLTVCLLLFSCTIYGQSNVKSEQEEDAILQAVSKLPEVLARQTHVHKESAGKRKVMIMIFQTPAQLDEKYYWVKVIENNGTNLVTHFNFYVYPKSLKIKYLDVAVNEVMSLKQWRQAQENKSKVKSANH